MPRIIALTGGIAMGKSTLGAKMPWVGRKTGLGLWLHDADKTAHLLMQPGGRAYQKIIAHFGDVTTQGPGSAIDRQKLGALVFNSSQQRQQLEAIVHPKIYAHTREFLKRAQRLRVRGVVLDIPLLFETRAQTRCDWIVSVSAPTPVQRRRALARAGMTPAKLAGILAAQASPLVRLKHSDIVLPSGAGVALVVREAVRALGQKRPAKRYHPLRRQHHGLRAAWPPTSRRHGFWRKEPDRWTR